MILTCDNVVSVQSKEDCNDYLAKFCLYTLPLARPGQAKIQMYAAICSIVKLITWNLVNLSRL